jgi:glycosyltransferase involved in cell wall biosynthesis
VRIAIDARPAVFPHPTGIGVYAEHLIRRMPALDPGSTYLAWYLNAGDRLRPRRRYFADAGLPNLRERGTPIPARWFAISSERWDLPRLGWLARFDVLFAPNFVPPPTRSTHVVLTVHDLAFRLMPETAPQSTRRWLASLDRSLRRAAAVIAVSETTKRDLVQLYDLAEGRITVIPHGVDQEVYRPQPQAEIDRVRRAFGIDGPYLLSLGGIEPRKNLPRLLEAFGSLRSDVRLVVAGAGVEWNPEGSDLLRGALDALPEDARRRVTLTGYVSEPDKVALLAGAELLAYPSLYEGFGLPVLEAMACGTPVVTSNGSALPEVAGDAAVLIDPTETGALRDALARVLVDTALRDRLRAAGRDRAGAFTWDASAARTVEVLHRAAG